MSFKILFTACLLTLALSSCQCQLTTAFGFDYSFDMVEE